MSWQVVPPLHSAISDSVSGCSWEANTYGYHGDDGRKYSHNGGSTRPNNQGTDFGPTYTSGDTVGAGLNLETQEIFFTYALSSQKLQPFFISS